MRWNSNFKRTPHAREPSLEPPDDSGNDWQGSPAEATRKSNRESSRVSVTTLDSALHFLTLLH